MHGVVVAGGAVAAACPAAGTPPLQQWDLLLLLNLLAANPSFRHSGDAMAPVCLPRFNPGGLGWGGGGGRVARDMDCALQRGWAARGWAVLGMRALGAHQPAGTFTAPSPPPHLPPDAAANLHAYVHYSDAATQTATVLLCGGMPDPGALAAAHQRMQQQLEAIGALQALVRSAAAEQHLAGGASSSGSSSGSGNSSSSSGNGSDASLLAVPSLPAAAGGGRFGATPLLHFVYKISARQQYVMAPFSRPLVAGSLQQVGAAGAPGSWAHGWGALQACGLAVACPFARAQHV